MGAGEGAIIKLPEDLPLWLRSFLGHFVGTGVLSAHCPATPQDPYPLELFLKLDLLFASTRRSQTHAQARGFLRKLDDLLDRIPASVGNVIYVDDVASKLLADRITTYLKKRTRRAICLESGEQIHAATEPSILKPGSILVVAGAIIVGQKLAEISQSLRKLGKAEGILYFVGVTRSVSEADLRTLKNTLAAGKAPSTIFFSVEDIYLPPEHAIGKTPWEREASTLEELTRSEIDKRVTAIFSKRIDRLSSRGPMAGLHEDLFWTNADGKPLVLTPGFKLWEEIDYSSGNPSQADVYFTMAAVLHGMRQKRRVLSLSPACFQRFNDGVIQAALLRAAYPGELSFRKSRYVSGTMKRILNSVFDHVSDGRGEACIEFLLAIAEERLVLTDEHTAAVITRLLSKLPARQRLGNVIQALGNHILRQLRARSPLLDKTGG